MLPTLCLLQRNQLKHASSGLSLTQILQSPSLIYSKVFGEEKQYSQDNWFDCHDEKNSINIPRVIHQYP